MVKDLERVQEELERVQEEEEKVLVKDWERVRKNKDGKLNNSDIAHNAKSYNKYMLKDNPWMLEPWALKQVPHPEKNTMTV